MSDVKRLLFIRHDDNDIQIERRQLSTLEELADVLVKADYGDWIQGLGSPGCHYDRELWRKLGCFIRDLTPRETEMTLGSTHV